MSEPTWTFRWADSTTVWHVVDEQGEEPRRPHCWAWYAGPLGSPLEIIFCCHCGFRQPNGQACTPVDLATKRMRMEEGIGFVQRGLDETKRIRATLLPRPPSNLSYQNVSAVIRNVVGGWNRR